jgi:hypothetical protein
MANEPISMSYFGSFTNDCSSFCKDKDGLSLWLTFVNDCKSNIGNNMLIERNIRLYSPLMVASICAFVALVCFMISYNITKSFSMVVNDINRKNNKRKRKNSDDEYENKHKIPPHPSPLDPRPSYKLY